MVYGLSNGAIFNDLGRPLLRFQDYDIFDAGYLRNGTRCRQFQWDTNRDLSTPYSIDQYSFNESCQAQLKTALSTQYKIGKKTKLYNVLCSVYARNMISFALAQFSQRLIFSAQSSMCVSCAIHVHVPLFSSGKIIYVSSANLIRTLPSTVSF